MKFLTPIIFIIAGLGIFFGYIDPMYQNTIKPLQSQIAQYNSVLASAQALLAKRDALNAKYTSIDPNDIAKLEKMLPDTIDNIRLVIDLNGIAQRYGMSISNLNLSGANATSASQPTTISSNGQLYGSVTIGFSVTTTYDTFLSFLKDLEQSLRILDVTQISFSSTPSGLYTYTLTIKTYWLK